MLRTVPSFFCSLSSSSMIFADHLVYNHRTRDIFIFRSNKQRKLNKYSFFWVRPFGVWRDALGFWPVDSTHPMVIARFFSCYIGALAGYVCDSGDTRMARVNKRILALSRRTN